MTKMMAVALGLALCAVACSDPTPPVAPTPAAATITETFTGTLGVKGNNTYTFAVQQVGAVKVILTSVDPSAAVGLGVGTPSTGLCTAIDATKAVAGGTVLLSGTATVAGNFCVSIYDIGNLVASVTYTITVQHS